MHEEILKIVALTLGLIVVTFAAYTFIQLDYQEYGKKKGGWRLLGYELLFTLVGISYIFFDSSTIYGTLQVALMAFCGWRSFTIKRGYLRAERAELIARANLAKSIG